MGSDCQLELIKEQVMGKLARRRVYGSNHKSLDTLKHMGWKPHERGLVEKAALELIREGRLRWYDKAREALQLADEDEEDYETRDQ